VVVAGGVKVTSVTSRILFGAPPGGVSSALKTRPVWLSIQAFMMPLAPIEVS